MTLGIENSTHYFWDIFGIHNQLNIKSIDIVKLMFSISCIFFEEKINIQS